MKTQREKFERWAKAQGLKMGRAPEPWEYDWASTASAWKAWQAAIESVFVDVSALPSASYTDDGVVYRSHVEDALDKAGIKYE